MAINELSDILSELMKGLHITFLILIASAFLAYGIAFIAGFCRLSQSKILSTFTTGYIELFRGTSLIVQLFWFSYALPGLFGIHLGSDIWAGILAISLNYGAYMSEIVRTSILSVSHGQTEAAIALNMSRFQRMRIVILPQAIRMMLPEFGNYMIHLLKATSLVSLIGLTDILYYGDIYRSTHLSEAPIVYLLILLFYFILALPLIGLTRKFERMAKKGVAN